MGIVWVLSHTMSNPVTEATRPMASGPPWASTPPRPGPPLSAPRSSHRLACAEFPDCNLAEFWCCTPNELQYVLSVEGAFVWRVLKCTSGNMTPPCSVLSGARSGAGRSVGGPTLANGAPMRILNETRPLPMAFLQGLSLQVAQRLATALQDIIAQAPQVSAPLLQWLTRGQTAASL